ncbi:hypothetical protein N0V88_004310 [Collariella sp. IMI 366227]|nr:hypothetical protein N0V88_004310 [Collariella sp. IMI 366227]
MSGNIAITGIPTTPGPNGAVPLRRELRDLQRNFPDLFNLYILGLKNLEAQDQSKMTSYYQIAGIHGMPYKPWNGQSLYNAVQEVAKQFPQGALRDKYVQAAKDFRAPYFDWASQPPQGSTAFPSALASPNVQVVDVDGKTKSVTNPLFRFAFQPVNAPANDLSQQWRRYQTTVRYPNRTTGQSQDNRIAPILANELASLRSNVSLLLMSYTNFDAFSYNRWDPSTRPGEFGSLEDVHNEIHDRVGGGGHMSSLDVSSFDPFFWLHHFNVDRLWAIWQDLNPTSFMSPRPAPYSTFSATGGESQTQNTPLAPFWDKSGSKFWNSAQVKDTIPFGYAYPETQRWRFQDQAAYRADVRRAVTALYGTNVFSNFVANIATRKEEHALNLKVLAKDNGSANKAAVSPPAELGPVAASIAQKTLFVAAVPAQSEAEPAKEEGPIPSTLKHLAPNNTYTEWVLNVRAQKHGLGASFRVLAFLGPFEEADPTTWDTEFNCVGRVSVLGRDPSTTQCSKCQVDAAGELMVSGTVPLTSALLQDIMEGEVASLKAEDVVPHLKEKLTWKVTLFDGEERDVAQVPGLKVSVASTEVTIGEDGLPDYTGVYRVWPEITNGKPGGLAVGEQA